jgi:integrase
LNRGHFFVTLVLAIVWPGLKRKEIKNMPWRKYNPKPGKHGSIYYIDKGVQVRCDSRKKWTVFIERNGKRINKTIGTGREGLTKAIKAAETIATEIDTMEIAQTKEQPAPLPTFVDFAGQWLDLNAKRWDPLTHERYEAILRLHIRPFECFNKTIDEVGRKDIKDHLRRLYKNRSPATVESVHAVISGIFNEAIDDESLGANPATGLLKKILPPKQQRDVKDSDPFTLEERDLFLAQAETSCAWAEQLILKVMAHAGLRLGETLAMRVCHFDPHKMTYRVAESYKERRFSKPKFGKPRHVDLPDFLSEELSAYLAHLRKVVLKSGKGGRVDLLFLDGEKNDSWPYSQRKIQGLVKRVCKGCGLRARNPHDLRHTYATIMLMAHQSPGYVQKQLGHSSISITMDIYCHWIPGEGRSGLEAALLGDGRVRNRVRQSHIIAYKKKRLQ